MPDGFQLKITTDQIVAILQREFGNEVELKFAQEMGGGTFNETYLVEVTGKPKMILRIAPSTSAGTYWDDVALMRREHHIRPFFASIAALMPQTILIDFTHQVIQRDYLLQSFMEGERWSDVEEELSPDENAKLWYQCGKVVQRIHQTIGGQFGYPDPSHQFSRWSEAVLDRLSQIAESMLKYQVDATAFSGISKIAQDNALLLDEINTPCLLHGDLWTFNLLIKRDSGEPTIVGVLDADRAWWGDPMADWIMFLLAIRRNDSEWNQRLQAFYEGYGTPESDEAARFRQNLYTAMHIGSSAVWCAKNGDSEGVARAYRELQAILYSLPLLLK